MGEKGFFMKNLVEGALPALLNFSQSPLPPSTITAPAADRQQTRPTGSSSQAAPLKYSLNQTKQARNNTPLSMTKQGTAHPAADRRTGSGYEKIVTKPQTNVCVKVHKKDPFILFVRIVNNTCKYPINKLE